MDPMDMLAHQGHRLIQAGVALFLFTSIWGFFISSVAAPRVGLSVHTLSALQGVMFVALGLVWSRLRLGAAASSAAFGLLIYSAIAILAAFVLASLWGAGNETMPIAAGSADGSPFEEGAIRWIAYSSAPTGISAFVLIFWGLRLRP